MFIFRHKNNHERLLDELKKHPNEMYVTSRIIAVWAPGLDRFVIITGRFDGITDEEANLILQERMIKLYAKYN